MIDVERRRVRIGPGARWTDVAAALDEYGWALSSGDYGGVDVGGLATAGGIGFLAREHGLTIDKLRAAEIVRADGSIVRTDAEPRPELFWAIRGAGANVGIVTAFEFEAAEVGEIGWAQLALQVAEHARGSYLSFDSSRGAERIEAAFPLATLARLRAIKAQVDPDRVFADNFSVAVHASDAA